MVCSGSVVEADCHGPSGGANLQTPVMPADVRGCVDVVFENPEYSV